MDGYVRFMSFIQADKEKINREFSDVQIKLT